jgi:hypothetical protein
MSQIFICGRPLESMIFLPFSATFLMRAAVTMPLVGMIGMDGMNSGHAEPAYG